MARIKALPADGVPEVVELARNLRSLKAESSMSYDQIARAAGFVKSTISSAANGLTVPTSDVLQAFVRACDPGQNHGVWEKRRVAALRAFRAAQQQGTPGETDAAGAGPGTVTVADLGRMLRDLISSRNHSLREVARLSGYAHSTVQKDTAGGALPRWERLADVLEALGVGREEIHSLWLDRWKQARDTPAPPEAAQVQRSLPPEWYLRCRASARRLLSIVDPMCPDAEPPVLDVAWSNAVGHMSDWGAIPDVDGEDLDLSGAGDDLADVWTMLPYKRLVLLGDAGAGASNLARRLGRRLVAQRIDPDGLQPVPLLVPLEEWDPGRVSLAQWVAGQAVRLESGPAGTAAAQLLEHGLLLPILDGFHDLSPAARELTLNQLSSAWESKNSKNEDTGDTAGDVLAGPLVITGRLRAYASATGHVGAPVPLSVAVRLEEPTLAQLTAFLPRSSTSDDQHVARVWRPVLTAAAAEQPRASEILDVLKHPTMAAAARNLYSDRGTDPGELLDPELLTDPDAVRERLSKHYLTTVYNTVPTQRAESPSPQMWQPSAAHLLETVRVFKGQADDLALRCTDHWPFIPRSAVFLAIFVEYVFLLLVVPIGNPDGFLLLLWPFLAYRRWNRPAPPRRVAARASIRLKLQGTAKPVLHGLLISVALLMVYAVNVGSAEASSNDFSTSPSAPVPHATAVGFTFLMVAPVAYVIGRIACTVPARNEDFVSVSAMLWRDALASIVATVSTTAAIVVFMQWEFNDGYLDHIPLGIAVALLLQYDSVWWHWFVGSYARALRPLTGKTALPRYLSILDDACGRGILIRQAAVYRFRDDIIHQALLLGQTPPPSDTRPPPWTTRVAHVFNPPR